MRQTIIGCFNTRREAELAVEHLVQEHGIERADVFIEAPDANSAGVVAAGADRESGHPGVKKSGRPALTGAIEVSVQCGQDDAGTVESALREAGATQVRS